MEQTMSFLREVGLSGCFDIAFMSLLIYTVIVGLKRTRAAFVLTGILILGGIYLLTKHFNLVMAVSVFESFFAVLFIMLVVIFQEELKHFFEEVAVWSLNRRLPGAKTRPHSVNNPAAETLVRTLFDLAREKVGALVIIRGKNILDRHLDGEHALNGELSEPILKSIFDPHSTGHDGAVVIEGERIAYFGCHLPLSKNLSKIKDRGTRHAAALGLSEVSDALCLVVSEERGSISIMKNGDIETVEDPQRLTAILEEFYEELNPKRQIKPWEEFFKRNTREKGYAFLLAVGMWFVVVYGTKITYQNLTVPVSYETEVSDWTVTEIFPKDVGIVVQGPRNKFYLPLKDRVGVRIKVDPPENGEGVQTVSLHPEDFTLPEGVVLTWFDTENITVRLREKERISNE